MKSNPYIQNLREYPVSSHKAWEFVEKGDTLKLDWNEADMKLPQSIIRAVSNFVSKGPLSWYPDIANKELLSRLSEYLKVPSTCIQYFEGSDCALDYTARVFLKEGDEVLLISPTYDNFRVYVESVGAIPKFFFADDIFSVNIQSIAEQISPKTKLVYLVNPNNPTGNTHAHKDIEWMAASFPETLFVVDEAYVEFYGKSIVKKAIQYSNIIVARSFSKAFGLASFRLGYVVSCPENISNLNKIRNGKNIAAVSQVAAIAALKNPGYMEKYVEQVKKSQALFCRELNKLGFETKETPTNFVLVKVSDVKGFALALAEKRIFVRSLTHLQGMENFVRITIGTQKSMNICINAIRKLIQYAAV